LSELPPFPTRRSSDLKQAKITLFAYLTRHVAEVHGNTGLSRVHSHVEPCFQGREVGLEGLGNSCFPDSFIGVLEDRTACLREFLDRKSTRLNSSHVKI